MPLTRAAKAQTAYSRLAARTRASQPAQASAEAAVAADAALTRGLTWRSADAHIWMTQCSAASTAAAARSREQQRTISPTSIALRWDGGCDMAYHESPLCLVRLW